MLLDNYAVVSDSTAVESTVRSGRRSRNAKANGRQLTRVRWNIDSGCPRRSNRRRWWCRFRAGTNPGSCVIGGDGIEEVKVSRKWRWRYRGSEGIEEVKVSRRWRYRGGEGIEEVKVSRRWRYRGSEGIEEVKVSRKWRYRGSEGIEEVKVSRRWVENRENNKCNRGNSIGKKFDKEIIIIAMNWIN